MKRYTLIGIGGLAAMAATAVAAIGPGDEPGWASESAGGGVVMVGLFATRPPTETQSAIAEASHSTTDVPTRTSTTQDASPTRIPHTATATPARTELAPPLSPTIAATARPTEPSATKAAPTGEPPANGLKPSVESLPDDRPTLATPTSKPALATLAPVKTVTKEATKPPVPKADLADARNAR